VLSVYFLRSLCFLNRYGSFLNWLGMHDIQKFNPDFIFVRSLSKTKLCKKIHDKMKEQKSFDWRKKKTKKIQKISVIRM